MMVQALELIHELQKHFPIKRCPLRIRAATPEEQIPALLEKLSEWNATIISKEGTAAQLSVVSTFYCSYSCTPLFHGSILPFHFHFIYTGFSVLVASLWLVV